MRLVGEIRLIEGSMKRKWAIVEALGTSPIVMAAFSLSYLQSAPCFCFRKARGVELTQDIFATSVYTHLRSFALGTD